MGNHITESVRCFYGTLRCRCLTDRYKGPSCRGGNTCLLSWRVHCVKSGVPAHCEGVGLFAMAPCSIPDALRAVSLPSRVGVGLFARAYTHLLSWCVHLVKSGVPASCEGVGLFAVAHYNRLWVAFNPHTYCGWRLTLTRKA